MEVVVEGVGPEENLGGFGGSGGAAVAEALGVAGEAAVGGEGFGEAWEGAVGVDVEGSFDEGADAGGAGDTSSLQAGHRGQTGRRDRRVRQRRLTSTT